MFRTLKQLFSPINKDLRIRLLFTLFAMIIFIIGIGIQIPPRQFSVGKELGFLELINVMGGGALQQYSIFALGVMPYITASIIVQILEMGIIPYFSELKDEGPVGRQKLNKITRYMGIIFAFIEGLAYSYAFLALPKASAFDHLYVAVVLTAGTAFLLWLGDQVTQKGIGNGISLLIMAGIVYKLPTMFAQAFNALIPNADPLYIGILLFAAFVLIYFLILVGIIFVDEAERRIPIQYSNKSSIYSNQSFMPIKVNTASVMPVIFASSLLAIPATIAQFVDKGNADGKFIKFVNTYLTYTKPVGFVLFIVLIFLFAYFYTFSQMKPKDLAKNLKENNGYIPNVRPGKDTENYISKILSRLTIMGAIFLSIIAGIPILFSAFSKLPSNVTIGGTSVLIVVGVALETYKQLEGSLVSRNYKKGYSRR